ALSLVLTQPDTKLDQHGVVEAGVAQWQMQRVLPGDAVLQREHRVAVGEILQILEDGDKGEQHRREGRLTNNRVEVGELLVVELLVEYIADEAVGAVGVEQRSPDPSSIFGHRTRRLWFEAHTPPPEKAALPLHGTTAVNSNSALYLVFSTTQLEFSSGIC